MPLKKIIVNSALDAIKGLSKLREEFAAIAAERNAYEAAVKNLYTKDMPSFDQWKALQAIPAQAPSPLAEIAKTTKPRSSKNKGLEEIPFRTDGSIDLSAVSKDQLLLLDNMARNDPSLIFRATPELGIKPRDSGAEGLFAGRTATGVAPYGDGTNFLGGDNPSLHILRLNSPHSSFSQYDLARPSRSTYSDPSAILNDLQYGLRNGFDQRRLYEFMNDEGLPISKAQIERILLDKGLRFRNNPNAIDEALKGEIGLFDPRDGLETPALQLLGPKMEPQKITYRDGGQVDSGAAFGIYPKQRATPSSKETKDAMTKAAKFAAETLVPQTLFDAGLMLIPGGRVARKAGAALMALDAGDAEAGGLSALMRLLSKEAPAQARQIREALGRAYTSNVEHSVVGSADKGPVGSIVSGTYDSVAPNQFDIARALKSNGSIADFHTHPTIGQPAFDVSPSSSDFRFASNEYFPGKQDRELRTIIASPADPGSRSPSAYSFFATDDPSKVFDKRKLDAAVFELQRGGSKGTFKSVLDDPRFREYFDQGGSMGELAENIAPLSLFDLRKAQGMGRGEVVLSGRPLSQNPESTNTELFRMMNPSAVELLTRKGFAKGGAVHMEDGGAAFGVFPQMKPRRALQDREAAANAPLSALRGYAAGTAGLPGDIEGLARMAMSQVPSQFLNALPALRAFGIGSRADPTPQLPTTEFYNEYLPGAQLNATPTGKAFTTAGNMLGGTGATTIAGLGVKGAKATGQALGPTAARMAEDYLQRQGLMPGVIKMPGGNFLKGEPESSVSPMKDRQTSSLATSQEEADYLIEKGFVRDKSGGDGYYVRPTPINTFIDNKIVPYIKNEMATPGDPLRAMAEKYAVDKPAKLAEVQGRIDAFAAKMEQTARERGVPIGDLTSMRQQMIGLEKEKALVEARQALHTYNPEDALHGDWLPEQVAVARRKAGFPEEGVGVSPTARAWENASDAALNVAPASEHTRPLTNSEIRRGLSSTVDNNPWLLKVPPETPVYYPERGLTEDLGFNHLVDELRNATNPESGLPKNLLIDPADLSKLTMPQAVDRVADINAWRATQKAEADLLRANNAATQLVKEYPEQGMKWVELRVPKDKPLIEGEYADPLFDIPPNQQERIMNQAHQRAARRGLDEEGDDYRMVVQGYAQELATEWAKRNKPKVSKELEDALKYEGDTLAHCVGGYCPDVIEGKSRIYSLRDDKGQPRVTIEVKPQNTQNYYSNMPPDDRTKLLNNAMEYYAQAHPEVSSLRHPAQRIDMIEEYLTSQGITVPEKITQIKGFRNKKPADEFLPFVQDFVKSGQWSDVGDLQNSGLLRIGGKYVDENKYREVAGDLNPDYISNLINNGVKDLSPDDAEIIRRLQEPEPGFAHGGMVSSNHFDPIRIKQIIASLDDEYDPERIQQIVAQRESAYA